MSEINLELLRRICNNGTVLWSVHITKRLQERSLYREDIYNVLSSGKIIEQYPDSYPHPSCLVSGKDLSGNPLHVVVAYKDGLMTMITAYFPTADKFEDDFETRKENI